MGGDLETLPVAEYSVLRSDLAENACGYAGGDSVRGTSLVTMLPEPMTLPEPIVTPGLMVTPPPTHVVADDDGLGDASAEGTVGGIEAWLVV